MDIVILTQILMFLTLLPQRYYNRLFRTFRIKYTKQYNNDSESASYLVSKIWGKIPNDVKMINSLVRLKKAIRKWKPVNCPCRICKVFIPNPGFVQVNILT